MAPVIVICSHDAEFFLMLQHIFEAEGFRSEIAQTVDEAVRLEEAGNVAAIILDCEQDFKFAAEICAKFRSGQTGGKVPIIARVVSGCDKSYIGLLKAGVDQVFARPVAPQWFLSSLRTIVGPGRDCNRPGESKSRLSVGGLTILPDKFRVHRHDGKSIHLSPIEFKILCVVAQLSRQDFQSRRIGPRGVAGKRPCRTTHCRRSYRPVAAIAETRNRYEPHPYHSLDRVCLCQ